MQRRATHNARTPTRIEWRVIKRTRVRSQSRGLAESERAGARVPVVSRPPVSLENTENTAAPQLAAVAINQTSRAH